jgi:hypothetical protein
MLLILVLCCLLPHQSPQALGIELAVVWSVWAVVLTFNQVDLIIRLDPVPAGVWLRTVAALVMSAFGIFAGISLWLESGGGLLWNVPANLVRLTIALFNAWNVTFAPEMLDPVRAGERPVPDPRSGLAGVFNLRSTENSRNGHLPAAQRPTTTLQVDANGDQSLADPDERRFREVSHEREAHTNSSRCRGPV